MSFIVAKARSQSIPRVRVRPTVSGGSWALGSLLLLNASGEWAECGADPALIGAVSEHPVGAGSGALAPIGRQEFPPNEAIGSLVDNEQTFHCDYAGTLPSVVGGTFGVTRGADGIWRVDFAKSAANQRVKLVSIDETAAPLSRRRVTVVFLAANVQSVA
jgi:hypothetical protein